MLASLCKERLGGEEHSGANGSSGLAARPVESGFTAWRIRRTIRDHILPPLAGRSGPAQGPGIVLP